MEAVGGFLGISQDPDSLALRPMPGWAVCEADKLDVLLDRIASSHRTFSGASLDRRDERGWTEETGLPLDLSAFYHRTNGAEIRWDGALGCRILPLEGIEPLDWGELPEEFGFNSRGPGGRTWHRFVELTGGSWLAINLDRNRRDPLPKKPGEWHSDPLFHAICHGRPETQGKPGLNPVVARSFTECLERLLNCRKQPYWLEPEFVSHGDAEQYTRRG
jgi:hypothetical protein